MGRRARIHGHARPYERGHHPGDLLDNGLAEIENPYGREAQGGTGRPDWEDFKEIAENREMVARYPFTLTIVKPNPLGPRTMGDVPYSVEDECRHGRLPTDGGEPCSCHPNMTNGQSLYLPPSWEETT